MNLEDLPYLLRYSKNKAGYDQRAKELLSNPPKELSDLARGNPNILDRYAGQRIAAESSMFPNFVIQLANQYALGDPFLDKPNNESQRTKLAGDLGRTQGSAPAPTAVLPAPAPSPGYGLTGAKIESAQPDGLLDMIKKLIAQGGVANGGY